MIVFDDDVVAVVLAGAMTSQCPGGPQARKKGSYNMPNQHVRGAGGDIDGRVEQLLTSAQNGGKVVYNGHSPPDSGVQGDGVPPSDEAAAQRADWLDEADDAVRFEAFEAVSSGTYALQPVSITHGGADSLRGGHGWAATTA